MAERVYLHIGAAKTGTSYLQQMIWRNREVLQQQGVFLPGGSRRSQFDAVADLRGGMWSDRVLKATWDEVAQEVREGDGVALLSEELLCGSEPAHIERVLASLAPVPVHVIHSARDIGRQIPAEWQQAVRARSPMSYDDYVSTAPRGPEPVVLEHPGSRGRVQALGLPARAGPLPPDHRASTGRSAARCCGTATARSSGSTPSWPRSRSRGRTSRSAWSRPSCSAGSTASSGSCSRCATPTSRWSATT